MAQWVKNQPAMQETGDLGFTPGLERSARGEWVLGQQVPQTNKVNQQVSDRVCELQKGCFFPATH